MGDENKISIDVELAIKQAQADLEKLQRQFTLFGNSTAESFARIDKGVSSFKGTLAALQANKAIEVVTDAAKRMFQVFIVDGVKASAASEQATVELNAALAQTGKYTKESSQGMIDLATEIQNTTRFEDDAVKGAEALIQTLGNLDEKGLKRATRAAVDMAAALSSKGVSLTSAADLVGKAAAGNTSALGRYGIVIDEGGTKAQRFAAALSQIEQKFGGRAVAAVNTYNGAIDQADNLFDSLQESTGDLVTQNPILVNEIKLAGKAFKDMADFIKDNKAQLQSWISQGALGAVDALIILLRVGDGTIRFFTTLGLIVKGSMQQLVYTLLGVFTTLLDVSEATIGKLFEKMGKENPFKNLAAASRSTFNDMGQDVVDTGNKIATTMGEQGALGTIADYVAGAREQLATHLNDVIDASEGIKNLSLNQINQVLAAEGIKRNSFLETLFLQTDIAQKEQELEIMKSEVARAEGEKRIELQRKVIVAENALQSQKVAAFKDSLTTIATLQQSKQKEFFFIGKAAALGMATINGAEAITKAWAQGGILGAIMAPLVALAVGVQIAAIGAQQPGFATGGVFNASGSSFYGDKGTAKVNDGEMFLTRQQQAGLFNFVAQGSQGGNSGGDTFVFNDTVIDSPSRIDELMDKISARVRNGVPLLSTRMA